MATASTYTLTPLPDFVLGKTTFRVERQVTTWVEGGEEHSMTTLWLHGPRKGLYKVTTPVFPEAPHAHIRPVTSWKSGAPLTRQGNPVFVTVEGDLLREAKRPVVRL